MQLSNLLFFICTFSFVILNKALDSSSVYLIKNVFQIFCAAIFHYVTYAAKVTQPQEKSALTIMICEKKKQFSADSI